MSLRSVRIVALKRLATIRALAASIRPVGWLAIVLTWFTFGWSTWRDELPARLQPPYVLDAAGWLPWWAWVQVALGVLIAVLFEASHREISRARALAGVTFQEETVGDQVNALGYLEVIEEGKKQFTAVPKEVGEVDQRLRKMTQDLQGYSATMPQDGPGKIRMADRASGSMRRFTSFFERKIESLTEKSAYSVRLWREVARREEVATSKGRQDLQGFRDGLQGMHTNAGEMQLSFKTMRSALENLSEDPPTRKLRQECERQIAALNRWIDLVEELNLGAEEAVKLADSRLNPVTNPQPASRKARRQGKRAR